MKTSIEHVVIQPAKYSFKSLMEMTDEEVEATGYTPGVQKWAWAWILEVQGAMNEHFKHFYQKENPLEELPVIKPRDFHLLNTPLGQFSWFIKISTGLLTTERPSEACPFEDPLLYVPYKWADRAIRAAAFGYTRIEPHESGITHGVVGIKIDGVRTLLKD